MTVAQIGRGRVAGDPGDRLGVPVLGRARGDVDQGNRSVLIQSGDIGIAREAKVDGLVGAEAGRITLDGADIEIHQTPRPRVALQADPAVVLANVVGEGQAIEIAVRRRIGRARNPEQHSRSCSGLAVNTRGRPRRRGEIGAKVGSPVGHAAVRDSGVVDSGVRHRGIHAAQVRDSGIGRAPVGRSVARGISDSVAAAQVSHGRSRAVTGAATTPSAAPAAAGSASTAPAAAQVSRGRSRAVTGAAATSSPSRAAAQVDRGRNRAITGAAATASTPRAAAQVDRGRGRSVLDTAATGSTPRAAAQVSHRRTRAVAVVPVMDAALGSTGAAVSVARTLDPSVPRPKAGAATTAAAPDPGQGQRQYQADPRCALHATCIADPREQVNCRPLFPGNRSIAVLSLGAVAHKIADACLVLGAAPLL